MRPSTTATKLMPGMCSSWRFASSNASRSASGIAGGGGSLVAQPARALAAALKTSVRRDGFMVGESMTASPKLKHADAKALRTAALRYPDTVEDFPWGHSAFKVKGKKAFMFMGADEGGGFS